MFVMAKNCVAALHAGDFRCDGVQLLLNDGEVGSQTAEHVHLHVVPRYRGDAIDPAWPERTEAHPAELASVADRLRAALGHR
jgi:histidine triad (HIT) family protein